MERAAVGRSAKFARLRHRGRTGRLVGAQQARVGGHSGGIQECRQELGTESDERRCSEAERETSVTFHPRTVTSSAVLRVIVAPGRVGELFWAFFVWCEAGESRL